METLNEINNEEYRNVYGSCAYCKAEFSENVNLINIDHRINYNGVYVEHRDCPVCSSSKSIAFKVRLKVYPA